MRRQLKDLLENSGDFSGAGSFAGGPYGFGNRYQLADSEVWDALADPAEDLPGNPSMWPAVHAQEDSDKTDYESLESAEVYDDKPHLMPGEDTVRDELLSTDPDLDDSYFYRINERNASDILYRDMPGFPATNTLVDPEEHVPEDEDVDRDPDNPEEERYNVPSLLPGGREGDRGKPFGHGRYEESDDLHLPYPRAPEDSEMYDANRDEITDNGLKLSQKKNQSLNRWKETEQENKGSINTGELWNQLVKPQEFIKKSWGQQDYKKKLDEPDDDVTGRAGSMGTLVHPVKHVPGPVDIYKKGNAGYSLGEAKTTMAKKISKALKRELEDYTPEELDKKAPTETYGNGMGQIEKKTDHDFSHEDRKVKKVEPLEPVSTHTPYEYDRERINTVIMSKLFEKLAALSSKE